MDVARLGLAVDSRPVAQASKDLDDLSNAGAKAEKATGGFRAAQEKLLASLTRIERVLASSEKHLSVIASSSTAAQKAVDGLGAANQNAAKKVDELAVANTGAAAAIDKAETAATTATVAVENTERASTEAGKAAQEFGTKAETADKKAEAANDNASRSAEKVSTAYGKWEQMAVRVARAVGLIVGALATNALFSYADQWSDMQSRVGAAIKDMEAAPALMQRIVDIANASYSPLDQTVEVYSRNVAVLRDLGRGATEAADFTEALNHALVITATRGERAASVQNALSKAMAVGKLQADGLETILANGGRVAEALAKELGTNVNGLRALASQGKITGDVIASALIGNLETLRDEAAEMPATIGDAFTRLTTNLTAFIGQMDQATGASQRVSEAIMLVADNIDVIARVAAVAGVALLTAFAPAILAAMASGFVALGTAAVAAISAITAAIAANPIGALAVALTTAVTAAYLFRDEIKQAIGVDFVAIIESAINTTVGVFVGGYEAITAEWQNLPAVMGDLAARAGQALVDGIVAGLNTALNKIREWYTLINPIAGIMKLGGFDLGEMMGQSTIEAPTIANPWSERAGASRANMAAIFDDAMSRDYVGMLKEIVGGTRSAEEATNDMAAAVNGANTAMNNTGDGEGGGGAGGKAKKALDKVKDAADKAKEAIQNAKQALGEGFGGILDGLINKSITWKDALLQAGRALLKYLDQMSVAQGGGGLFGSGFFGGLMKGLLGFAKGGAFQSGNIVPFAKGGVVNKPTVFPFAKGIGLMGEAGPEAIMPLRRGPDGRLGVSAPRQAANDQPLRIEVVSRFDADGGFETAVERTSRSVAQVEAREASDKRVGAYNDQQRRGGAAVNERFYSGLKRRS